MPVYVALLRGVNVTGHSLIKMAELRVLFERLKFENPQTYVQSGNVVFRTRKRNEKELAKTIRAAIEKKFGCSPEIMLRTTAEMRTVVEGNPFAGRSGIEPSKLLVNFLLGHPEQEFREKIEALKPSREELHLKGREIYIYFADGIGPSKFRPILDRLLKTTATGRNWNSVTKLLELAESMEKGKG